MYWLIGIIVVLLGVIAFGIYKHITLKKAVAAIEADLELWLADAKKAEAFAVADVKAHFTATVQKIEHFFVKYFSLK